MNELSNLKPVIGREEVLAFARERRAMGSGAEKQVEAEVRFS